MKKNNSLAVVVNYTPDAQKRTVSRAGKTNGTLRCRECLTPQEIAVQRLLQQGPHARRAKQGTP